jgi:hypothetical protein
MGKMEHNASICEGIEVLLLLPLSKNRLYYRLPPMCQSSGVATAILSQQEASKSYL